MRYATHWARLWSLVGAVGVGLSFLVWRPLSVLTVFLTASLCAGILLVLVAPADGPHTPMAAMRWSRIGSRAGLVGAAVVSVGAVAAVLPALALPLLLAAALSSPLCVDQVRRWRHAGRSPGAHPAAARPAASVGPPPQESVPVVPVVPVVAEPPAWPGPAGCRLDVSSSMAQELTDQELCQEWRRSFVTLQSARSAQDRGRVVVQRQVYLDELERRSPTALQAWLDSGARAAGGPERFLTQRRPGDQSDAA